MGASRKLLNADESVVLSTRTHPKALLLPLLLLILLASAAGLLGLYTSAAGRAQPLLLVLVWGAAALAAARWVVVPFLRWLTTTYTLTDQRLATRYGVLGRRGRDVPLARVRDVTYERGVVDRLLGCGTLLVAVASEQRVRLYDIPDVERVHLRMQDLLHDGAETRMIEHDDRR